MKNKISFWARADAARHRDRPHSGLRFYESIPRPPAAEPSRRMPAFLIVFLLLTAVQFVAVVAVNVAVDPRADFGTGIVEPVITNDAALKAAAFRALPRTPETLVLGSSRSIAIPPAHLDALGYGPAFNFALSGGTFADAEAALRFAAAERGAPERILVGLDVTRVYKNVGPSATVEQSPLASYVQRHATAVDRVRALVDTYTFAYARDSGDALWFQVVGQPPSNYVYENDGLRRFLPAEDANAYNVSEVLAFQVPLIARQIVEMSTNDPIRGLDDLRSLVRTARALNVTIHLFVSPYHPQTLQALSATPFPQMQATLASAATELCGPDLTLADLTDIGPAGFYDGWHFVGAAAASVAEIATAPPIDACA